MPDGAAVTIGGDTGVLNATGNWGAGIGGGMGVDAGTITINGGVINATSNGNSAGIGGGGTNYNIVTGHYDADGDGGVITISGGTVTADASGMCYSAGIGGGAGGDGGTINVTGGTIVAKGSNSGGAGIGGGEGFDNFDDGAGGDITINDAASVTAVSSGNKPAIDASSGSGSVINARLNSALSESDTYLQCGSGRSLTLPGSYRNFAFSATAASTVKVYVNPSHATLLGSMIQTADNSPNIAEGLPSVTTAVKLYAPTVTIKKDGAAWAAGTPTLKLSTSQGALTGAISGTRVSNAYTFTGLNAATAYYVWDTTGNYYTGKSVTRTGADVTLDYYTVTLASGTGINSTTGGGTYLKGSNITFYAEVASGYNWSGWTQTTGGALVSTSNSDTIVAISSPISYTANAIATYALTVSLDGGNGATVSGSYASGAAVSIDAGTRSGYTFNGWTSSSGGAFTNAGSASTTFTMPGNATTITANWTQNGGGGSSTPPANNNTIVIVDNKDYSIGTENKNGSSTTATVDQAKLTDEIAKASEGSSAIFPVSANTTVTAQLVVKNVEDMAQKDMTLTVRTGGVAYNLNTSAIDTAAITAALGTTDSGNIPFNVTIAGSNVAVNGATLVVSPVEFTITCTYNGKTVAVDTFSSFVSRTVEITAEQATKITTAVVVEMDGSLRHVPTKVTVIGGKYYAVINSLTNSTYSVVWHPIEFSDVTNSWAKDAINNMGSRMVVNGVGGGNYEPDRDITRAEFAAIVVRALGLDTGMGSSSFTDVASGAWYYGYVQTAVGYGVVSGYGDGTFGPNDTITREQAMTMLARAMKITGLAPTLTDAQATLLLSKYTDASVISDYAKASVAACVDTGVVLGRTNAKLAAKDAITRAEVAAIVERLLRKSNLI